MSTTTRRAYAVVYEGNEADGTISAYVPDLAVYVTASTYREAEASVRTGVTLFLEDMAKRDRPIPEPRSRADYMLVKGLRAVKSTHVAASALGHRTSARKAAAAAINGRKGGRPRKNAAGT